MSSLFGGGGAAGQSKQYADLIQQLIGRQTRQYDAALPQYNNIIDYYAKRAGVSGSHVDATQASSLPQSFTTPPVRTPTGTVPYGSNQGMQPAAGNVGYQPQLRTAAPTPVTPAPITNPATGAMMPANQKWRLDIPTSLGGAKKPQFSVAGKGDPNGVLTAAQQARAQQMRDQQMAQRRSYAQPAAPAPAMPALSGQPGMSGVPAYQGPAAPAARPAMAQPPPVPGALASTAPPAPGAPAAPVTAAAAPPRPIAQPAQHFTAPAVFNPQTGKYAIPGQPAPAPAPQANPAPMGQPPSPVATPHAPPQSAPGVPAPTAPQYQNPYLSGPPMAGGVSNQQLGIYNQNDEDRLRNASAQDDINRYQVQQQDQIKHQLGQRGMLDSSVYGGALSQLGNQALQQYSDYRRQLATGAGQEQDRRMQQLYNTLAPSLGYGQQAIGNLGGLQQNANQLSQQSSGALQALFSALPMFFK